MQAKVSPAFFISANDMKIFRISLFVVAVLCCQAVSAQSHDLIVFDGSRSESFGSKNLLTAHKIVYSAQDRLIPDTLFRENKWWKKGFGFVYRMSRFALFDAQIDYFTALTQHEVFGHGARYREMGHRENSFHLNLFFPYGDGSGFARSGPLKPGVSISPQERIAKIFAGNEANQVLAQDLSLNILLNNKIHYRQASLFLITQNNLAAYIWQTRLMKNGNISYGNDITSYLFEVNALYGGQGKTYDIKSLSEQCLISLANPIQLYAAYSVLIRYGIQGKKQSERIPRIRMGKLYYLPALNYSLSPFGSRYHLVQYFTFSHRLLTADLHMGDQRFYPSYGLKLSANPVYENHILTLNACTEIWQQAELELDYSPVRNLPQRWGGLISVEGLVRPLKLPNQLGLYLLLGYKTKGYTMGEALDKGLILRFGLSGQF